jgi:Bacterial Ig-like domain (group 2)
MVSARRKLQLIGSFGALILLAVALGCNGFFVDPQLVSIALSPPTPSLLAGGTGQQMTAIGTYDDGSKNYNLNAKVTWTMSPSGFATITQAGLLTGTVATTSPVTLTATVLDISGTTSFTVSLNNVTAISVQPSSQTVSAAGGLPVCLQALATVSGSTTPVDISASATWTFLIQNTSTVETGLVPNSGLNCTAGAPFTIGNLSPNAAPVNLNVTASYPAVGGGTITSTNVVVVNITQ